ncbi:hypothetical protein AC630_34855 [Bradyrhizobium sp. AS23.2]|nr:hypothetical protein AC630_34855 [Bradyrhizobium sp. AS23.2]
MVAGMVCCGPALAADLPVKAPAFKAAAPVSNWTGWYVGVNAGASLSQVNASTPNAMQFLNSELDVARLGATGGAQAGFNWQISPYWVAGIEADFGHLGIDRTFAEWNDDVAFGVKADWYGTIRGRLGYTTGPSLLYLTGGAAFVNVKNVFADTDRSLVVESSKTATGWTLGGGIETMLGGNWSAKAEYLYIDAGRTTVAGPFGRVIGDAVFENRFHVYRAGLNYRLGSAGTECCALASRPNTGDTSWTGGYVGVNAGASVSQVNASTPNLPEPEFAPVFIAPNEGELDIAGLGATGSLQAGFNWQASPHWVAGLEADFGHLGINRTIKDWNDPVTFGVKADWYGTIRGRLGYTTGPSLLYVTGGAAFVNVKSIFGNLAVSSPPVESSKTATGWTLGGGLETMLGGNWSAKAEYLYIDAGKTSVDGLPIDQAVVVFDNRFHVYRAGLNYRLGG